VVQFQRELRCPLGNRHPGGEDDGCAKDTPSRKARLVLRACHVRRPGYPRDVRKKSWGSGTADCPQGTDYELIPPAPMPDPIAEEPVPYLPEDEYVLRLTGVTDLSGSWLWVFGVVSGEHDGKFVSSETRQPREYGVLFAAFGACPHTDTDDLTGEEIRAVACGNGVGGWVSPVADPMEWACTAQCAAE
jgi:hypothetical protein